MMRNELFPVLWPLIPENPKEVLADVVVTEVFQVDSYHRIPQQKIC